jgi:hypothetical protein
MTHVERDSKRIQVCIGGGEEMRAFKEAEMTYVQEVVRNLEMVLGILVDAYTPPVLPWS